MTFIFALATPVYQKPIVLSFSWEESPQGNQSEDEPALGNVGLRGNSIRRLLNICTMIANRSAYISKNWISYFLCQREPRVASMTRNWWIVRKLEFKQ